MKKKLLVIASLLAVNTLWAEEPQEPAPFTDTSAIAELIELIPGGSKSVPWLPDVMIRRHDASRFNEDKTMVEVHRLFGQWCKARSGKILQPRENNCAFLKNSLGCAVGELQYPGIGSDFERGIKDAATASGDSVNVGWPKAAWLLSENTLFNIFANKGANQVSIVGGLQRCMADRSTLINAMAFVSINGNNDLLFLDGRGYDVIARRGAELSKLAAERKKEEAARKKAQETARVAALKSGDYVIHATKGWRGLIVEMKTALAQVQWDKGFGEKSVEWHRLEELKPMERR